MTKAVKGEAWYGTWGKAPLQPGQKHIPTPQLWLSLPPVVLALTIVHEYPHPGQSGLPLGLRPCHPKTTQKLRLGASHLEAGPSELISAQRLKSLGMIPRTGLSFSPCDMGLFPWSRHWRR